MGEETKIPQPAAAAPVAEALSAVVSTLADNIDPPPAVVEDQKITHLESFKEDTNVVNELPESHKKALDELKSLVQEALNKHEFTPKAKVVVEAEVPPPAVAATEEPPKTEEEVKTSEPITTVAEAVEKTVEAIKETTVEVAETTVTSEPTTTATVEVEKTVEAIKETIVEVAETTATSEPTTTATVELEKTVEAIKETIVEVAVAVEETTVTVEEPVEPEEVSIWGIPLLADERSDVILLKFLRARDFKVKDAFAMIKDTVSWRKEFGVDSLLDQDLGDDYNKVVFTHGHDKQGRPVCYNVLGEFQNKELYQNTFSDAEKRNNFLKWLIKFVEKTIRTLDFSPKGINSFVLVTDLNNAPGFAKRDLYKIIDKFLQILQDNYPEFVAKQLCINVSWWYLAYNWVYLTVFTPRSKSKLVFASPSKTAETIFKYIAPEQVPVQFGGHSHDGEHDFSSADPITQVIIKPGTKHLIDLPFSEETEVAWELRVIGWEVTYGAEFIPQKEGAYTLNIAKPKKLTPTDEAVISDTFKIAEPGKVVLTIDNHSSKKKKLLYRSKVKTSK